MDVKRQPTLLRLVPVFQVMGMVVYALLKLLPLRRRVVMMTRRKISASTDFDTFRAYLERHHPAVPVVEMIHPVRGKVRYLFVLVKEVYYLATSRWVITDSYMPTISMFKVRKGVTVVQIWHALGAIKRFGRMTVGLPGGVDDRVASTMRMHENYDYIAAPSVATAEIFQRGFGVDSDRVQVVGSPRIDYLLNADRQAVHEEIVRSLGLDPQRPIYLYAPTFRDNGSVAVDRLAEAFRGIDAQLVIHMHTRDRTAPLPADAAVVYSTAPEVLSILPGVDGVITDYSAVVFEVGILGIPLALWAYDQDEYAVSPGFALDYDGELSDIVTADPHRAIELLDQRASLNSKRFHAFMSRYIETADTHNCHRLMALLVKASFDWGNRP